MSNFICSFIVYYLTPILLRQIHRRCIC